MASDQGQDVERTSSQKRLRLEEDPNLVQQSSQEDTISTSGALVAKEEAKEEVKQEAASNDVEKGKPTAPPAEPAADPNIVFWDGPDDPENPVNFSESIKWTNIAVLSILSTITPLASSMFAPGVPQLMDEFHSDSDTLATFVVSVYVLGFAFGPMVVAPLSEIFGRLWVFHASNIGYTLFTIACALAPSLNSLIEFRFIAGCLGIAPLTVGGGTISDLIAPEKRGRAMSIWSLGPILGPVIGPVIGGFLAAAKGWRWIFWLLAILSGAITIVSSFTLGETYPPTLLARKTKLLQKETGNMQLRSKLDRGLSPKARFTGALIRPAKMLLSAPICIMVSIYSSTLYGSMYLLFTTFTYVFEGAYGFSEGIAGLTYLGIGIGSLIGLVLRGALSDRILKRLAAKNDGKMKPESRMVLGMFTGPLIPIGLFIYGWTTEYKVHWIVPQIGTVFIGLGLIISGMGNTMYLIDTFKLYAASAIAANTVLRSIFGATFPLFGLDMYDRIGLGWGNSLLAFVTLGVCVLPWTLFIFGEKIRAKFPPKL